MLPLRQCTRVQSCSLQMALSSCYGNGIPVKTIKAIFFYGTPMLEYGSYLHNLLSYFAKMLESLNFQNETNQVLSYIYVLSGHKSHITFHYALTHT